MSEAKQKYGWIEEYQGCPCCTVERRKKDLLGYCQFHGGSHKNRSRFPIDDATQFGNSEEITRQEQP